MIAFWWSIIIADDFLMSEFKTYHSIVTCFHSSYFLLNLVLGHPYVSATTTINCGSTNSWSVDVYYSLSAHFFVCYAYWFIEWYIFFNYIMYEHMLKQSRWPYSRLLSFRHGKVISNDLFSLEPWRRNYVCAKSTQRFLIVTVNNINNHTV